MSREGELPESAGLGDVLDQLFRSGFKFTESEQPPKESDYVDFKERLIYYLGINIFYSQGNSLREKAKFAHDYFPNWPKAILFHEGKDLTPDEVETLKSLTIQDMAKAAEENFDKAAREMGQQVPDSAEEVECAKKVEFWDRVSEITPRCCRD